MRKIKRSVSMFAIVAVLSVPPAPAQGRTQVQGAGEPTDPGDALPYEDLTTMEGSVTSITNFSSSDRGCADLVEQEEWIGDFGYEQGWDAKRPRLFGDVNGDRKDDVVAFGGDGTYVSISSGEGFLPKKKWVNAYGINVGGWDPARYPRMLGDVNGDGREDVVGFGNAGVYVSRSTGSGFTSPSLWVAAFGYGSSAGSWRVEHHPRVLADVNGDGRQDVVGFGNSATWVSLSTGNGFAVPSPWTANFGANQGWGDQATTPRLLADVNGDGLADVVGFGVSGAFVSISDGDGFANPSKWISTFGSNAGWTNQTTFPRVLADVNGDRRADIVGFGSQGAYVSVSTGSSFATPQTWLNQFGTAQGWGYPNQMRALADMNNDGRADIIAINHHGVWVSASKGDSFGTPKPPTQTFGSAQGWHPTNHPRMLADVNGDGAADVAGFGNDGVHIARGACPRRAIPVRFIQAMNCEYGTDAGCTPKPYAYLERSTSRANHSWSGTGVEFWIQSDEFHDMPILSNTWPTVITGTNNQEMVIQKQADFSEVWSELVQPFPDMAPDAYEAGAIRWEVIWLDLAAALYSDPNAVTTWLNSGQSSASFPNKGRRVRLSSGSLLAPDFPKVGSSVFGHELGHFLGLTHLKDRPGPDPTTSVGQNYVNHTLCALFDLVYKPGPPPQFLLGDSPNCTLSGGYRYIGADARVFGVDAYAPLKVDLDGTLFNPGDLGMSGILRATGRPHSPPQSYGHGWNVMGGFNLDIQNTVKGSSEWNTLGLTPRFVSDAQAGIVRDHLSADIAYEPVTHSRYRRDDGDLPQGVSSNRMTSLRTRLGRADDDFFWFSNATSGFKDPSFRYARRDVGGVGYQPVSGDFDGNGADDIVWYLPHSGETAIWWFTQDGNFDNVGGYGFYAGARPFVGDFDGNGIDDLFLYRPGTSSDVIYFGLGNRQMWGSPRTIAGNYQPVAADLDGDGDDDVIWYNAASGTASIWWSNAPSSGVGTSFQLSRTLTVGDGLPYRIVAGDFDGSGSDEVYWFRPGSGLDRIWSYAGGGLVDQVTTSGPPTAHDPFVGDFNADGYDDIFWDAPGLGNDAIRLGASKSPQGGQWKPFQNDDVPTMMFGRYRPVSGDFDADGDADIFWYRR